MRPLVVIALVACAAPAARAEGGFACPMHADVRSGAPGRCPRCGMALVREGLVLDAYDVEVLADPRAIPVGKPARLTIALRDPKGRPVGDLETIHEKPIHLFLIHEGLDALLHVHPEPRPDGRFSVEVTLPAPGRWQLVADFVPRGGTPQLVQRTLLTAGWDAPPRAAPLSAIVSRDRGVTVEEAHLVAGAEGRIVLRPGGKIAPWLGAPAHLLLVSPDLEDVVHAHGALDGDRLVVPIRPPRAGRYRLWVQLLRDGELVTAALSVDVEERGARLLR